MDNTIVECDGSGCYAIAVDKRGRKKIVGSIREME